MFLSAISQYKEMPSLPFLSDFPKFSHIALDADKVQFLSLECIHNGLITIVKDIILKHANKELNLVSQRGKSDSRFMQQVSTLLAQKKVYCTQSYFDDLNLSGGNPFIIHVDEWALGWQKTAHIYSEIAHLENDFHLYRIATTDPNTIDHGRHLSLNTNISAIMSIFDQGMIIGEHKIPDNCTARLGAAFHRGQDLGEHI